MATRNPETPSTRRPLLAALWERHNELRRHLEDARLATVRLCSGALGDKPREELHQAVERFTRELGRHQIIEEEVLFPRLLPHLLPLEKARLAEVSAEHAGLQRLTTLLVEQVKTGTDFEKTKALIEELRINFDWHERTEEAFVQPATTRLLDETELGVLAEMAQKLVQNHR